LMLPGRSSGAFQFELSGYAGSEWAGGALGYVDLAGQNGVSITGSFFRFIDGVELFERSRWRGSALFPTLDARAIYFPGGSGPRVVQVGVSTSLSGFRLARCFGALAVEFEFHAPTLGGGVLFTRGEPAGAFVAGMMFGAGIIL